MLHCCCNDSTLACCSVMRSAFCNFLIYDGEEEGSDLDEDESVTLNEVHACTVNTHTRSRHLEKLNLERVSFLRCSWRQVTAACGAVSASPRRTWPAPNPRPSARMHAQPTERGCRSYNCRICGEPKKGHVCRVQCDGLIVRVPSLRQAGDCAGKETPKRFAHRPERTEPVTEEVTSTGSGKKRGHNAWVRYVTSSNLKPRKKSS